MASKRNEFKYEKQVLNALGVKPTRGSGNTWVEPEDGEDERFLYQLKSTQNKSISMKLDDILMLCHNAKILHKHPAFLIDICGVQLVCVRPEHLPALAEMYANEEELNE